MAALVAGVQYGLSSSDNFVENKQLIFVKLTDSAFRAIEDYLKNKNKSTQTPTIQFLGNDGHLSFPTCRGDAARFNFSLSSNQDIEGPQGSFECIQQTGSRCLESLGAVHCKMRIMAKDDVYEATRHRMAAAEQQHKQNCTREIKLKEAGMTRKYSRSTMAATVPPRNGLQQKHAPTPPSHTKPQGNNHAQKPGNPDIMRRPLRDRLIHLLAVRPYKKPELYSAIIRDGVRDKDKNHLMSTLSSIATVRDNTYHLMRHVWNDVQDDWPFYTEQDRQMLKRRKPQNLTPPGSSDGGSSVGSGQSPSSVHPGSPPSTIEVPSHKRPGYYKGADGLPTKRQRIAHNPKRDEVFGRSESPGPVVAKAAVCSSSKPSRYPQPPPQPQPQPDSTTSPDKETERRPPPTPKYKFLIEYVPITSVEQRRRYKEDFNSNYAEYRRLHTIVAKVSGKFAQLEQRLLNEEKDSDAWKRIKNQILQEYQESKKDRQHHEARKRFQYLHEKLSHIKRLVLDYDTRHHT